eukprot:412211-Pyramimonas_sp.AAC.2
MSEEEKPDWEQIFRSITSRKFDNLLGQLKVQCSQQAYAYAVRWAERIATEFHSEISEVRLSGRCNICQ